MGPRTVARPAGPGYRLALIALHSGPNPYPSMLDSQRLLALLESSDPANPGPDETLDVVLRSRKIAVVGISRDPLKAARRVPSYLVANGFDIIPVNPNASRILGKTAYRSLEDVTEPVDIVLLFRPSDQVGPFVRAAAARPERPVIWLQEGIRSDREAREAREAGRMVIQDLCIYKVHRESGIGAEPPKAEPDEREEC